MPYWRLSGFYFFYFAALGTLIPYWGLYLQSIGFTALQIGNLMALLMISRIIAPNIWGWIADHREQRMSVVRWAALLSFICYLGVFFGTGFWWLAVVMMCFSFFWNASLPQLEAATMSHLEGKASAYARVRLWGSVGFIIAVIALGLLLDRQPTHWLLPIMSFFLFGIFIFSLSIPESDIRTQDSHRVSFLKVLVRPEVFAFLLACLLMQASHGPYYTFYSIYLAEFNYPKSLIGGLWAFGVFCEIGVFLLLHRLQKIISLKYIIVISSGLAALRWFLIGSFPEQLAVLIIAQMLHAATFGAYHAAAVEMVHGFFRGRHQIRGQAIYGSISFGLGGAIGSFYSGLSWNTLGATSTFFIAAGLAATASCVTVLWIKPKNVNV